MKRLYNAVCGWLEADAESRSAVHEPMPEGNNFAQAERVGQSERMELNGNNSHDSIDNDYGGAYRLGFTGGWKS